MTEFDVAVLGLGAMGAAAFYQLARMGVHVVGIDRYRPPHSHGSTHGESRITRQAIGEGLSYVPLVQRSHQIWRELETLTGKKHLHEVGGLILSRPDDEVERPGRTGFIRRTREAAEKFGIVHEILTADDIVRRYPQFNLSGDEIGFFEPGAGYVDPELCVSSQLRLGQEHGGNVLLDVQITAIESDVAGLRLVSNTGHIRAKRLIVSAGAGAPALLGGVFTELLRPTRQTMHWFGLDDSYREHWSRSPIYIWPHGSDAADFFYGFPEIGGLGAVKIADEFYGAAVNPDQLDRTVSESASMEKYLHHIAPRLRGVSSRRLKAVTCLYTATPDSAFIIDHHPEDERILVVSPCSGHGFKHSAAIGEAAAQWITLGGSAIDLSAFSLSRFGSAG